MEILMFKTFSKTSDLTSVVYFDPQSGALHKKYMLSGAYH